jgi:hypothetical protein
LTAVAVVALALALFSMAVGLNLGGTADRLAARSADREAPPAAIASPVIRVFMVVSGLLVGGAAVVLLVSS